MFESKSKTLVIAIIILSAILGCFTIAFAKNNESKELEVSITSDCTKDSIFEDTKDITFEVKDNPYVVSGKIAPGMTAVAKMNVNIEGEEYPVDFTLSIDETELKYKNFELIAKLDGEEIQLDKSKVIDFEKNSTSMNKIVTLELKWNESSNDTEIGILGEAIELPITVKIEQHI